MASTTGRTAMAAGDDEARFGWRCDCGDEESARFLTSGTASLNWQQHLTTKHRKNPRSWGVVLFVVKP
jgi:hypothetical protein